MLSKVMMQMIYKNQRYSILLKELEKNMLVGYGLVVGLNGTGDNLRNSGFDTKTL